MKNSIAGAICAMFDHRLVRLEDVTEQSYRAQCSRCGAEFGVNHAINQTFQWAEFTTMWAEMRPDTVFVFYDDREERDV